MNDDTKKPSDLTDGYKKTASPKMEFKFQPIYNFGFNSVLITFFLCLKCSRKECCITNVIKEVFGYCFMFILF